MIDLSKDGAPKSYPNGSDKVYELLQSYYGRLVRVQTSVIKMRANSYEKDREIVQSFGRVQGLRFLRRGNSYSGSDLAPYLYLILEGQDEMFLKISTLVVEVLQEDTGEWTTVYLGSEERKKR